MEQEKIYFSASKNAFYGTDYTITFPADAREIPHKEYLRLLTAQEGGQRITSDGDGYPVAVDYPTENPAIVADNEREYRMAEANNLINSRQWPSKLALQRLSETEKSQFNAWLDYLDALGAVDTSTAPDVEWPEKPE